MKTMKTTSFWMKQISKVSELWQNVIATFSRGRYRWLQNELPYTIDSVIYDELWSSREYDGHNNDTPKVKRNLYSSGSAIKKKNWLNKSINPNKKRWKDTPFWSNLGEHGMNIPKAPIEFIWGSLLLYKRDEHWIDEKETNHCEF